MGKNGGFLTAKSISNRQKSRGLQKLKWWCQMCSKQCRDENGFQCHIRSEGHMRQMSIFKKSPGKYLSAFSGQFEAQFMRVLSGHNDCWVDANTIYRGVISDKNHVHMNGTHWSTLTGFVAYLGESGKCEVEESDRGWRIRLINQKDPEYFEKKRKLDEEEKRKEGEEARREREIKRARKAELKLKKECIEINDKEVKLNEINLNMTLGNKGNKKKKKKLISRKKKLKNIP
eukprot:augustus_masked-scaffold_115-processed-gene-0.8-mRNA-1 protein AED:0.15 eAED:0.15 QI:0/-1/0/1/-1/1/1/0/230